MAHVRARMKGEEDAVVLLESYLDQRKRKWHKVMLAGGKVVTMEGGDGRLRLISIDGDMVDIVSTDIRHGIPPVVNVTRPPRLTVR